MGDNRSDNELIRAFQDGDEDAPPTLFERHKNLFVVWASCLCANPENISDAFEQARETIVEPLRNFDLEGNIDFKIWLMEVTFQSVCERYKNLVLVWANRIFPDSANPQVISQDARKAILDQFNTADFSVETSFEGWLIKATLNSVVEKHKEQIYGWAIRICRNHDDALEISQEAFIAIWRYLARHKYNNETAFKAWLKTITIRKAINFVLERDRLRTVYYDAVDEEGDTLSMEIPDPNSSPEERVIEQERGHVIRQAIESLPDMEKKVIKRRYLEGLQIKEIAVTLGLAEGTVKAHLDHAKAKLRKQLEPLLKN